MIMASMAKKLKLSLLLKIASATICALSIKVKKKALKSI